MVSKLDLLTVEGGREDSEPHSTLLWKIVEGPEVRRCQITVKLQAH